MKLLIPLFLYNIFHKYLCRTVSFPLFTTEHDYQK